MHEYSVVIHPVMARELAGKTTNTTQIEKFKNRTATFSHEIMKKSHKTIDIDYYHATSL